MIGNQNFKKRSSLVYTLYGCKTTIVFTLKMESVPKITIFGLKMMSNGLEKYILKFLHSGRWLFLLLNL